MNMTKCWHCNAEISSRDLFCPACSIIQPPSPADHFTRLNMSKDFNLGIKKLEVEYFALQTKLHPDRFARKSEKEKIFSMQQSMSINEAYETLKNPLSRAEYMLKLEGVIVNADNPTVKPSQEILMESLETRERLAGIKSPEEIRQITIETAEHKLSTIEAIRQDFIDRKLDSAAQNTIKLKYLEKLMEEIKGLGARG